MKGGYTMNDTKVVMITGASKGLGKALALTFARNHWSLALCARNEQALEAVKQEALESGAESVLAIQADGAVEKDMDRLVSLTESTFGHIDVLIVNASIFGPGPAWLLDYDLSSFQDVLLTNVLHPFMITKRVLPGMLQRKKGTILHVTSEAGKTGFAEWGAYGISKFALEGLAETWANELTETDIALSWIDPGEMDTDMHAIAVPDCDYPLAKPEDVANVFFAIASRKREEVHGKRFEAQALMTKGGVSL
jgi:NAD(P)-dependent dehydrogenase (short-subunit alcohol dehydrogenase family)